MKFDFAIGNPPYQETQEATSDNSVYNYFMDEAYKIANKAELIHPARFLFNAGKTSKAWNEKILNDEHFKVMTYEQDSSKIFRNTDIKGGIAITYHDNEKSFGKIKIFTVFEEINSILKKVISKNFKSFSELVYAPESYKLSSEIHKDLSVKERLSDGHENDITTNIFEKLPDYFLEEKTSDGDWIKFIGLVKNKRVYRYILRKYIVQHENLDFYKVILPKSNGSGALGEVLSTPLIGQPLIGHTQSFLSIGKFKTEEEAIAVFKYIKTKFARTMLGVLKITQDNKKSTWKYVPLQDFTPSSDIDWAQSISELDKQLYKKYNLSKEEIDFIESHVKEMN